MGAPMSGLPAVRWSRSNSAERARFVTVPAVIARALAGRRRLGSLVLGVAAIAALAASGCGEKSEPAVHAPTTTAATTTAPATTTPPAATQTHPQTPTAPVPKTTP